eukprot:3257253-Prymnesium_polylepis.1
MRYWRVARRWPAYVSYSRFRSLAHASFGGWFRRGGDGARTSDPACTGSERGMYFARRRELAGGRWLRPSARSRPAHLRTPPPR